jgi:hypothetical protein
MEHGAPLNSDDAAWARRQDKRWAAISAVKKSSTYVELLVMTSTTNDDDEEILRPMTPDPRDRSRSKRTWEKSVMSWRRSISLNITSTRPHAWKDVCLIKCFRFLGYIVPFCSDGPFLALQHGNDMLRPLGYGMAPCQMVTADTSYVVWQSRCRGPGHFIAVATSFRYAKLRFTVFDDGLVSESTEFPTGDSVFKVVLAWAASQESHLDVLGGTS